MKKYILLNISHNFFIHKTVVLIFVFTLSVFGVFAQQLRLSQNVTGLIIGANTSEFFTAKNTLSGFNSTEVKTEKGTFTELTAEGYGFSSKIGDPKIPQLRKLIEVPMGCNVQIKVISYNVEEYNLNSLGIEHPLIPVQPSLSKNITQEKPEFRYNEATYKANKFNEDAIVSAEVTGIMRGLRIACLTIAPVQYNPVANKIKVFNNIVFEVSYSGANNKVTGESREKLYSPYFENIFKSSLVNYKPLKGNGSTSNAPVKYVIVSDPIFHDALQPFVLWKTKKGFKVVEAYTNNPSVGNTNTSIREYLKGLYDNASTTEPAPSFVLFVGDVEQVPSFVGVAETTHVTDLYYCEYTGDFFPEAYYGRFSATDVGQLEAQTEKTMEYEQYKMPDPLFLNHCILIAGQDAGHGPVHGNGQMNYLSSTYFNSDQNYSALTYYYENSGNPDVKQNILNKINEGIGIANYTAHGNPNGWSDPSFTTNDVAGLSNTNKYPLIIGNCCQTNKFDNPVCFGESLLRASKKGALGYIGGSADTYWDEDFYWACGYKIITPSPIYSSSQLGAFDRIFHNHGEPRSSWCATQYEFILAGNLAVEQSGSSYKDYYWEIYHLMGDPSLMPYLTVPSPINAVYSQFIPIGTNEFTVRTEPWSYVAISLNGKLYGAAWADTNGIATITTETFLTQGIADVVITAQNKAPYIGTAIVESPTGPYVLYSSNIVNDISGNQNGKVDYGEDINLGITLHNYGLLTANTIQAIISSSDTNVVITDSICDFGDISSNSSLTKEDGFAFSVKDKVNDGHAVPFIITITDNNKNVWKSDFYIVLNAPVLRIKSITIDDADGNNNGRMDPGENVNIIITASNSGHAGCSNVESKLSIANKDITVNTLPVSLGDFPEGTDRQAVFNVTISPLVTEGILAVFTNSLTSGLYTHQESFSELIGIVSEDFEEGNFSKFKWKQGDFPWTISSDEFYHGKFSAKSGKISHSQKSDLSVYLNVLKSDSLSFYVKTSSEPTFDVLKFFIDNYPVGEWSGNTGWKRVAYYISEGYHTFKWSYIKDQSITNGDDYAWLDYIVFPPVQFNYSINENISKNIPVSCFPNPAKDKITFSYTMPQPEKVQLKIYNSLGQEIIIPEVNEEQSTGLSQLVLNVSGLKQGLYFYVLNSQSYYAHGKIVIER